MKTVLSMFKGKESDEIRVHNANGAGAVTAASDDFAFTDEDFADEMESEELDTLDSEDEDYYEEESGDVFEDFTNKVQSLLDDGAISLEIAEEKTAHLEEINPESRDYQRLVEEIKIAQAQARQSFDDAEFLIKRANEIMEENRA